MSEAQLVLLSFLFAPLAVFAVVVALWRIRGRPAPPDEPEPDDGLPVEEGRDPRW